jgi:hypothetical protein
LRLVYLVDLGNASVSAVVTTKKGDTSCLMV